MAVRNAYELCIPTNSCFGLHGVHPLRTSRSNSRRRPLRKHFGGRTSTVSFRSLVVTCSNPQSHMASSPAQTEQPIGEFRLLLQKCLVVQGHSQDDAELIAEVGDGVLSYW